MWQMTLGKAGPMTYSTLSMTMEGKSWLWDIWNKYWFVTLFRKIKKKLDKNDNIWHNRGYIVQQTLPALCPHPFGIHLYVQKVSYCEHLHLSARSFVLVVSKLSPEHSCQRLPQKAINPGWLMRWIKAPASLPLRWDNSEACSTLSPSSSDVTEQLLAHQCTSSWLPSFPLFLPCTPFACFLELSP